MNSSKSFDNLATHVFLIADQISVMPAIIMSITRGNTLLLTPFSELASFNQSIMWTNVWFPHHWHVVCWKTNWIPLICLYARYYCDSPHFTDAVTVIRAYLAFCSLRESRVLLYTPGFNRCTCTMYTSVACYSLEAFLSRVVPKFFLTQVQCSQVALLLEVHSLLSNIMKYLYTIIFASYC